MMVVTWQPSEPDAYGISEGFLGSLPPGLLALIGQVVVLPELLETKVWHLVSTIYSGVQEEYAASGVSKNIAFGSKRLRLYEINDAEKTFALTTSDPLGDIEMSPHTRNAMVHGV